MSIEDQEAKYGRVMIEIIEPKTERLQLRQWAASDREPLFAMSTDPQVMKYFPVILSRSESDTLAEKCETRIAERRWGVWAAELLDIREFIGVLGLNIPRVADKESEAR